MYFKMPDSNITVSVYSTVQSDSAYTSPWKEWRERQDKHARQ